MAGKKGSAEAKDGQFRPNIDADLRPMLEWAMERFPGEIPPSMSRAASHLLRTSLENLRQRDLQEAMLAAIKDGRVPEAFKPRLRLPNSDLDS